MPTKREVNLGVIGAGRIGRLHIEHLAQRVRGARLLAVADSHLPAAQEAAARFGIAQAVADYRRLLDDAAIEAVVICSPTDTHTSFIEQAARAGKHIFCEKPVDHDLARIDRALAAVAAAGVKLQVGFNRRFDASFRRVREAVAAGAVGTPHIVRITSRDPSPPPLEYVRVSGGLFLDMTIHDFDMARYLIGQEVTEVYAAGAVLVDPLIGEAGDVDTAAITLRFAGGAIGVIDNSRRAVYGYDQRVEVFGSAGMVTAGNQSPDTLIHADAQGLHRACPPFFFVERYADAYIAEMQSFVDCLRDDTCPLVDGRAGRAPVAIGLAARKSCQERRPVQVSEIDPVDSGEGR